MTRKEQIINRLETMDKRSAWNRGVNKYAFELLENVQDDDLESINLFKEALLNGAISWDQYSWGGCSLIYNSDIAERLCTPSEFKRTRGGEWRLNNREEWLDVQARALFQAANRLSKAYRVTA